VCLNRITLRSWPNSGFHHLPFSQNQHSRFVETFKRQFAAQEVESLQQRTSPASTQTGRPQCECLVALEHGTSGDDGTSDVLEEAGVGGGAVLGCIDIRLPSSATGLPTAGVPEEDPQVG
jgi:hypothetical protein